MPSLPEERADVQDADLSETTAVVTGSTSGIGREIALTLGRLGAHVVVHGRDREAGSRVVTDLEATAGSGEFIPADFAAQDSVRAFADSVLSAVDTVDLLYNNAGGLFRTGKITEDGIEYTFAVNHLAPFLLTHLLLPAIPENGRVITTSSGAHQQGSIDFESLQSVSSYSGLSAYNQSKLANILFTRELARRVDTVSANCFHPGFVPGSDFFRELPTVARLSFKVANAIPGVGSSVEQGAATAVYLGVAPVGAETDGGYFSGFSEATPSQAARDDRTATRLWERSEELTGLAEEHRLRPMSPE